MKRNLILEEAFEEATRKELEALPKEEEIVRVYSEDFERKMEKLLNGAEEKQGLVRSKRKIKWVALIAAVLACVMSLSVAAVGIIKTLSPEWLENMRESALDAEIGDGIEEFDKRLAESTEPFAVAAREAGDGTAIILDYSESIEFDNVKDEDNGFLFYPDTTATTDNYIFELKSITKGEKKHMVYKSGRIADGSVVFEWKVSSGYFAVIEASREDGKPLSSKEKDGVDVMWHQLLAGYSPVLTDSTFNGAVKRYTDDYKIYFAVEITDMMPFAGTDFALVAFGYNNEKGPIPLHKDVLRADHNGTMELVNKDKHFGVLLRFSVPEEYASEDEHHAEKYFEMESEYIRMWMDNYQTDEVEYFE